MEYVTPVDSDAGPYAAPSSVAGPAVARPILPLERLGAGLEVLLCSGLPTQLVIITVLSTFGLKVRTLDGHLNPPFIFALTLSDTALLVGLVLFFLRAHRESLPLTLFGHERTANELWMGLALVPLSFGVVVVVLLIAQLLDPALHNVPQNPFADLARMRGATIMFAFVVVIAGGVREEIQRGFILHRFEQYLGGGGAGLLVFSVIFGLGHLEQGRDIALATAALGVFWGTIYLRRRSVLAPMIGHAGFNLAQVVKFFLVGS